MWIPIISFTTVVHGPMGPQLLANPDIDAGMVAGGDLPVLPQTQAVSKAWKAY